MVNTFQNISISRWIFTHECTGIRFSRKRLIESPEYSLNHQQITLTSSQKYLSIIITSNLKWSTHISNIVSKANQMLGFLRRNCTHLTDTKCRRLLYLALVRAHLCYGSELWAPQSTSKDLLRIEGVQRRATKYILQDYHTSYPDRNFLTFSLFPTGMRWKISFPSTKSNLDSTISTPKIISTTQANIWPASAPSTHSDRTFAELPTSEIPFSTELFRCGTAFLKTWNLPPLLPSWNINWRFITKISLKQSLTLIVQGHGKLFVLNVALVVSKSWERVLCVMLCCSVVNVCNVFVLKFVHVIV